MRNKKQGGATLVIVLIAMLAALALSAAITVAASYSLRGAKNIQRYQQAYYTACSSAEMTIELIAVKGRPILAEYGGAQGVFRLEGQLSDIKAEAQGYTIEGVGSEISIDLEVLSEARIQITVTALADGCEVTAVALLTAQGAEIVRVLETTNSFNINEETHYEN